MSHLSIAILSKEPLVESQIKAVPHRTYIRVKLIYCNIEPSETNMQGQKKV